MFELGSAIVLAIVEGATSALTSHVLKRKTKSKEPMDMRLIVNEVAKELRARDRSLEISVAEMDQALKSLRGIVERVPQFEMQQDDKVTYRPRKGSEVGDVLYRLDEEIAALRKSVRSVTRSNSHRSQSEPGGSQSIPQILEGLDDEIASLRTRDTASEDDRR